MPEKLRLRLQHFAEGGTQDPEPNNNPEPKDDPEPNDTGKGEGEKTFTQEDVDQIIKDRVAREKKSKEDAVKEAEKLAKMNKDQKAEYEREQMQKELDLYKAKEARNEMKKHAGDVFKQNEITPNDELLELVTADTADQTQANVQAFNDVLNNMVKEQVQAKLYQGTPKNYSNGSGGVTRESIMNIADDSQRQQAIAQNRHLF
ncbi:DUF4355 domain-containing protein [Staphylococcus equorum]|uniref:DUF4355 domain-containing protein n=1 Tax=Staphylococcus equorum TaxID=246432 RepID=A0AAP7IDM3_9STAP|nr:DUF4355 domain-containing protein [Staphylococcus equorum]OEK55734.1 hypothetical protein ASS94_09035 [Staphylococcus equorum]OEK56587.1 hypothetical protein ASS97_06055 [Staphylococcus equorum]OEK64951.1 hypothetical protein ASS98_01985 [Staphylococcus equorum]QPT00115.1 DUF4355 domain-containing protein [Staphylococcus equorum]RYD12849.1 DUF4355 domain-containing protein [Staphylococcus equorum]